MAIATSTDRLWVPEAALNQMRDLAATAYPHETGGMLLGYHSSDGDVVVTAIIGPGPRARHSRLRFAPDHPYQQELLEQHFTRTEGRETYLGDWHTHPDGACALSSLDKRVLTRIARSPQSGTTRPTMVVLAGAKSEWRLCGVRFESCKRLLLWNEYQLTALVPTFYTRDGAT